MTKYHSLHVRLAALALVFAVGGAAPVLAADFAVLTFAKVARFEFRGDPAGDPATVVVGPDAALQTVHDPSCPATSSVEIEAYLQSTFRDSILGHIDLDCAKWTPTRTGFRYTDPTGTVRSIRYGSTGLRIKIRGPGYVSIPGPVGFLQAQLAIGDKILRARFHNFNNAKLPSIVSRKPSRPAAAGEAGFWGMLLAPHTAADEQAVLNDLETAVARNHGDGRSYFLLAMTHLYRFGQQTSGYVNVGAAARAELAAANNAFAAAVPLLWDDVNGVGDSRVPGFAASAKYLQGFVENDAALQQQGIAELDRAIEVNAFFNVFDYMTVLQTLPASDPLFQHAFSLVSTYLDDPEVFGCAFSQPELCANEGFAPHNTQGSLTLFGDVYAKAGNLSQAQFYYNLANAFPDTPTWPFLAVLQDRLANAPARVALYGDADPSNDPPLIGTGAESCAVCHRRQ